MRRGGNWERGFENWGEVGILFFLIFFFIFPPFLFLRNSLRSLSLGLW